MALVKTIGRLGSDAYREIREGAEIWKYKAPPADVIMNYGMHGDRFREFLRKHPSAKNIPIINKYIGMSKYEAIKEAEKAGLLVPESKLSLSLKDDRGSWIEKRHQSSCGYGICMARSKDKIPGKYYQRFIKDRVYELRIAAFLWVPTAKWGVYKRHGDPDKVAWNFKQGGHFAFVHDKTHPYFKKAMEASRVILEQLRMGFGAVDFIVDQARRIYFIEVNSAPGFTDFSRQTYIDAFVSLKNLPAKEAKKFGVI
jgi:glutathione synthase/RimK-type ligase-like ATP-grasp enzyme